MRFLIISHALHKTKDTSVFSYAPYVREMNLWLKHVGEVEIVAPLIPVPISSIELDYKHKNLTLTQIPSIEFTSISKVFNSLLKLPVIFLRILKACKRADHIHLRCPGNIGLLGCVAQIFFPKKNKTAKYAGNWDPKAKQPLSYRLQKWILSNTFLTRNMQVLVYGDWKNQSKNIKPFFTATFSSSEIEQYVKRDYSNDLNFVFTGTLVKGKQPLFAIKIIERLHRLRKNVFLDIYGDGVLKESLQEYIQDNKLEGIITLHGNKSKEVLKEALKKAHFSILPSQSEGWPKVVAEAMFFGVIPIATKVSCLPFMLDHGKRGLLINGNLEDDLSKINKILNDFSELEKMSLKASLWSQLFTLDKFESEIVKLL